MNLPWGIVIPIHLVKCTKLITLYAFFNLVPNVQILPRHFLPVFVVYDHLTPSARAIALFSFGGRVNIYYI
jgi:hypothetical protein